MKTPIRVLGPAVIALLVPAPTGAAAPTPTTIGAHAAVVRVLHFGDSHTGAAAIQAMVRGALQQSGAGGPGYLLPWAQAPASLRAGKTAGWLRLSAKPLRTEPTPVVGLGGAALEARHAGERAWFEIAGTRLK